MHAGIFRGGLTMNDEHSTENNDAQASPSPTMAELKARCEQLERIVHELREQRKLDAQALAELSEYRNFVYEWARQQVREEDWQDFSEADYTMDLGDAIKELERQEQP